MRVVELFSGIGSQTKAIRNLKLNYDIIATCEWSVNSIISYGEIHEDNINYNISRGQILKELSKYTFSIDTKTPYNIETLNDRKLYLLYKNHINSKNLGSIIDINSGDIPSCELMTYTFPCQDLSSQGKQMGLLYGKSSSILWQVGRLIKGMDIKPNILLMENVPSILNSNHIKGFKKWKHFLNNMGYYNYVLRLKGVDYGAAQYRERCFMISSLYEMDGIIDSILSDKIPNKTIKDICDSCVDDTYYKPEIARFLPLDWSFQKSNRGLIYYQLKNYSNFRSRTMLYSTDSVAPTVTATGANTKIKIYDNGKIRILTPREIWRLMGFDDNDFNKVSDIHSDTELLKQAGNSIIVNVLESIFKNIDKFKR
jgi:DNA (cytosine-5)-methyltransferase 1